MARKSRQSAPYIGDQILAVYQGFSSCCGLSFLTSLAVTSFALTAKPSLISRFEKDYPSEVWRYLQDPKYTLPVGLILATITILDICWIVATWRGRRWAIWLHLIFNGPGAILGLVLGARGEIIFAVLVATYCVLRLNGNVGQPPPPPPPAKKKRGKPAASQNKKIPRRR